MDNEFVSRTGYNENDLVDYNAMNFKFSKVCVPGKGLLASDIERAYW